MEFLKGKRLVLRALEPEDLDILYTWENDTTLWKYGSTLTPYSRFSLRQYIENSTDFYQDRQLRLMIVLRDTGRPVGTIDLYDFDPFHQRAAVGILLEEESRSQGLGSEALQMMIRYAFRFLHLNQLYAFVPVSNRRSYHLFLHSGFTESGKLVSWQKTENGFETVAIMQLVAPPRIISSDKDSSDN